MNQRLRDYYDTFSTNVLISVLENHMTDLNDVGHGVYVLSKDRFNNLAKRVEAIRSLIKERLNIDDNDNGAS